MNQRPVDQGAAPSRRTRVPAWVAAGGVLLGLGVGLFAGPAMPWVGGEPGPRSAEAGFARDMVVHHDQAVRMSLAALTRAADPEVRQIAVDVVLTQRGEVGSMQSWLEDWELPTFDSDIPRMAWMGDGEGHALLPDGRMPGMATSADLQRLETLTGLEFDKAYLSLMYSHHEGGIPMAAEVLDLTDRPEVVTLATSIRDSQTSELDAFAQLLRKAGAAVPAPGPGHSSAHDGGGSHSG